MPTDKYADMEEKLWILEDLNMMYIRQIALSLQMADRKQPHMSSISLCYCAPFQPGLTQSTAADTAPLTPSVIVR
ncbi:hypothetical protein CHARACLAT_030076 [Characodon lateralis]|uniref:Uncharacterized protein n=1 Tax=Characodon lateralis TaxID=208331 RepID=A0ABU7DVK3_9TELE|nr:hypothetical protein [Characodon lateralis]